MKWSFRNWAGAAIAFICLIVFLFFMASKPKSPEPVKEGPYLFHNKDQINALTFVRDGQNYFIDTVQVSPESPFQISLPSTDGSFEVWLDSAPRIPAYRYEAPARMLVLSDIEGDFEYLQRILKGNGVIDEKYQWTYGKAHLVILGDVFDRGKNVTECLWLIYKLDQEAKKAGGQVHFILGNHEIMDLTGDHRYVVPKYRKMARKAGLEYRQLFGPNTVLGQWLRSKNSVEIIGSTLFAHGGLSTAIIESDLTLDVINQTVREYIDHNPHRPFDPRASLVLGSKGPLWFRGYADQKVSEQEVSETLDHFQTKQMVIGHTIADDVEAIYDRRVYLVDVDRKDKNYLGLLIENEIFYKIDAEANKTKL